MDQSEEIQQRLQQLLATKQAVHIVAGNSKAFYGRQAEGEVLSVAGHTGIVEYDFRELVVTARAGTTLAELRSVLAENNQYLPFDPPSYADNATLGGTLACGFSGPARPYAGSARDYVLGSKILNGRAELLTLGGQVMKNVAGYDLSRLMVGALGSLGIILQASLKVLPRPAVQQTLVLAMQAEQAITEMNRIAGTQLPLNASAWFDGLLYLRFAGFEASVSKAVSEIGGETLADADAFWDALREHRHSFFSSHKPLWRLSVPATTPVIDLPGQTFYDWGGAQRWFVADTDIDAASLFEIAGHAGGHATLFRHGDHDADVFQPLPDVLMALHRKLRQSLDPQQLLNPGRMYADF
jgi:glycolate oxidase FAD binding subunit